MIELCRRFEPADQGIYSDLPFTMPSDVERLDVHYEVKPLGDGPCAVDLGLADPTGVRGWSGGARRQVAVSANAATPGYAAGPLQPGEWFIVLGIYEVPKDGCVVRVQIKLTVTAPRWRPGDLHMHSLHSDGKFHVDALADQAAERGLEFIAVADHNTFTQNDGQPRSTAVTVIPAMEWTSYTGHANLYGVARPIDDFRCRTAEEVATILDRARDRGARISLNHPFDDAYPSGVWRWGLDLPFDWAEIWNGPWRACNQDALDWWDAQLQAGRHLPAVGGSDYHRPGTLVQIGRPTTWVYSERGEPAAILDAVTQGRAVLSCEPSGPLACFSCGEARIGDTIPIKRLTSNGLQIEVTHGAGDTLRLISAEGLIWETTVDSDRWDATWFPPGQGNVDRMAYVRLELWRNFGVVDGVEVHQTLPSALTNPLHLTI